ncbi:MAG: uroporphyrinogen-III C-methyltransferase [Salinivirgaceae bacterium]|jgi:uroporphyrin-III C-methyltransferase/precorrin-2 dehydrogenase/sirohydrochlorin ferrochelatase|nr:uroporphyrinogen-III C-methyltransferase [Salinivirgaceae bacterium]
MSYLPISINVKNKNLLIVGGGKVALKKLQGIIPFSSKITIIAPSICQEIVSTTEIVILEDIYRKKYLKDVFLVYACTNSEDINKQVLKDAEELGVLCNRTDKAEESHFHSLAIVRSNNIIMGINSINKDCKGLVAFKNELQSFFNHKEELLRNKEQQKGKVYLVGFGPGSPDLLTKRGEKLLYQADEIFYDDLLDSSALNGYPGQKIYVGKRRDNHSKQQSEINEILFQSAKKGNMVVRLKGGDPLIFGRGSEERFYLEERGISVEIIPGISSAIAAASYANIPLTHRGISSSVAFGTAHGKNSYKILESDTSVYYMGAKNIVEIAKKYLDKGYSPDYPVGLVHNVSMPEQEVVKTNIRELANGTVDIKSPVISIFGNTVNYQSIMKKKIED